MSRFLLTLWDGGGNVPPVLSVAGALVRHGHDVRVLADPVLGEAVRAVGAQHRPWTTAPHRSERRLDTEIVRDFEARTPFGATTRLRDRLIVGPAARFADDTLGELGREPADVVALEALLLGCLVAAEAAGVRSAMLVPNIYPGDVPGCPPFGMGLRPRTDRLGRLRDRVVAAAGRRLWDARLDDLNALRARHGLRSVPTVFEMFDRPDRVLVLTSAAFEHGAGAHVPPHVRYCGPRLDDPLWAAPWTEPPGDDPLVLVSLSTTFQDQGATLRRVIDALGRLPVRGLVTTGPAINPEDCPTRSNVTVVRSAPHAAVLDRASAAITHAGHGTVIKALAHGVPLVCLPMGRDQPDTAARVVSAGAGLRLPASARGKTIAAAVSTILNDPGYRSAAERLAATIAVDLQSDLAVQELEALCT